MIEISLIEQMLEKGVTIVVLGWFMFRMEKVINKNSQAIESMHDTMIGFEKSRTEFLEKVAK